MSEERSRRSFRFGELRRSGLFGSMPLTLLVPVGIVVGCGWAATAGIVPWPVVVPLIAGAGVVAVGRVHGRPLHTLLPALTRLWWRRLRGRNRWVRPVPLVSGNLETSLI